MSSRFDPSSYTQLRVTHTDIPSLLVVALQVFGDSRGWFKENYHREKMAQIGLPASFDPLQNNISYNNERGITRGIHAEPWDKYITIASGEVFAAIVDLRKGPTFGKVATFTLNPGIGLFVPKGCGNSYQTLENDTVYSYLVNDYWKPDAQYVSINPGDKDLAIQWPVPLELAELSDKDRDNPAFKDIQPMEF